MTEYHYTLLHAESDEDFHALIEFVDDLNRYPKGKYLYSASLFEDQLNLTWNKWIALRSKNKIPLCLERTVTVVHDLNPTIKLSPSIEETLSFLLQTEKEGGNLLSDGKPDYIDRLRVLGSWGYVELDSAIEHVDTSYPKPGEAFMRFYETLVSVKILELGRQYFDTVHA